MADENKEEKEESEKDKRKAIVWLSELSKQDIAIAGGKGANLAEMWNAELPVPPAFIVTAQAYHKFLRDAELKDKILAIVNAIDLENTAELEAKAKEIRQLIVKARMSDELASEISEAYEILSAGEIEKASETLSETKPVFVAVRSSATTEDLSSISKDDYVLVQVNGRPIHAKVSEIYNKFNSIDEIKVPSMKNNKIVWVKVEKIYKHKANNVKLFKIETEKGREITVSPNHSLIVLDRDTLKPKTVQMNELKNIDLIPTISALPEINSEIKEIDVLDYLKCEEIIEHNNEIKIKSKSSNWKIQHGLKRKIFLTNDFAYFLGVFVAEGSTYGNNTVIITNSNKEIMHKVKKFLKSLNLYTSQKINRNSLRVHCKTFVKLLHALTGKPLDKKGKGRSCYIKKVPNFVFGCKKEFISNFLKGCFDGDGSVKNTLSYTSTSKELIGGIVKLLEILGIAFLIRRGKNYYTILIPIRELKTFKKKVGFTESSKIKKLDKLIALYDEKQIHPNFKDHVFISEAFSNFLRKKLESNLPKTIVDIALCPICNKQIEKTSYNKGKLRYYCKKCKKIFYEKKVKKKKIKTYVNYDEKGRFIRQSIPWNKQKLTKKRFTKKEFEKLINKYNLSEFTNLLNSSVDWDKIKKVTPVSYSNYVYDFTVPEIENFAAGIGGIITHNTASFAGQQETYLNIKERDALIEAIKKCWASLFTARAIYYRARKGFSHETSLIAVIVQKMINAEKAGVTFTINPLTNNKNEIVIEAVFGLGEGIVSGTIEPDNYVVDKANLRLKTKRLGKKKLMFLKDPEGRTVKKDIPESEQDKQVLDEHELKSVANYAVKIEDHYKWPQDIEWAIEGGKVYVVQSRPVTTVEKEMKKVKIEEAKELLSGLAASSGIASGKVKIVYTITDLAKIQKGDILVAKMTNPDMVVTMQKAAAIVTNEGGLTCHAAIVSREVGVPSVVGTKTATEILKEGQLVTVDGTNGKVYEGKIELKEPIGEQPPVTAEEVKIPGEVRKAFEELKEKRKEELKARKKPLVKVNCDLPDVAERAAATGADGVGLVRIEFIIAKGKIHPAEYIRRNQSQQYTDLLTNELEKITKAFKDKPVWIRTSDIRTDEYKSLEGADKEPKEDNPMIGWHGIRRSLDDKEILKAEFKAINQLYEKGYKNIGIMIPFLIYVRELKDAKKLASEIGLPKGVQFGVMIETPASCWVIEQLCQVGIDFISFGTNDLTQLTLGIDRNNEKLAALYNELHPGILGQIAQVIKTCRKYGVQTSICGQAGSRPEMAKFLTQQGITSISANIDAVQLIREAVDEEFK